MHLSTFVLVIFSLFLAVVSGARRAKHAKNTFREEDLNCDTKNNEKIDLKMAKILVIGDYGRPYPEDRKQLKTFCDESSQILNYINTYKDKCFKGTLKQFSALFIYSNRNSIKRFCSKNNKQVPQLLKAAKCVNKHMKKLNVCMSKMTENYLGIKYADDKKKIPHICCEFVGLVNCFAHEMRNTECSGETDTMLDFLRSLMGNFVDSTCGDYNEDSDRCSKLGKAPRRKANEKIPKSILYPLHDIINSLPQ